MSSEAAREETLAASPIGRPGPTWQGDAVQHLAAATAGGPGELPAMLVSCSLRRRLACLAIDQALAWGVVLVLASIALAVAGVDEEPAPDTREARLLEVVGLLSLVAPFFYFWVWNSAGYTPGKQMLGVRIVNARGEPPGMMRGFARTVASLLVLFSFGFSYAWAAWDSDAARPLAEGHGQAWHDKLSGTFVVRVERA